MRRAMENKDRNAVINEWQTVLWVIKGYTDKVKGSSVADAAFAAWQPPASLEVAADAAEVWMKCNIKPATTAAPVSFIEPGMKTVQISKKQDVCIT